MENTLIYGDNILGLEYLLDTMELRGKVDLVYIDPPFATNSNFMISEGRTSTISSSNNGNIAYSDKLTGNDYLEFIRERLKLIKELLSDQGSIYLHIDYKIGHYVKVLMDEVFGIENFKNDITRIKCNPKNFPRIGYGNIKDLILFYSKTKKPIWHEPKDEYSEKDLEKLFPKINKDGRRYTTVPIHAPGETNNGNSSKPFKGLLPPKGRHWRTDVKVLEEWDTQGIIEWSSTGNPRKIIFADTQKGKRVQDIWDLKDPQYPVYPTEKNSKLLELIVTTSSNPDSIILDCFCGSGTSLLAAHNNNRKWIGIDESQYAIKATQEKLDNIEANLFIPEVSYTFVDLTKSNRLIANIK